MTDWIDEASSKVDEFFENADDDELEEAMNEAGYDFYKEVESPIAIAGTGSALFYSLRNVRQASGCMSSTSPQDGNENPRGYSSMEWGEPKQAADEHSYAMAA